MAKIYCPKCGTIVDAYSHTYRGQGVSWEINCPTCGRFYDNSRVEVHHGKLQRDRSDDAGRRYEFDQPPTPLATAVAEAVDFDGKEWFKANLPFAADWKHEYLRSECVAPDAQEWALIASDEREIGCVRHGRFGGGVMVAEVYGTIVPEGCIWKQR
jgi:DNA-directed RNA polymerase subunit M/transcription elongation factor TFIIS